MIDLDVLRLRLRCNCSLSLAPLLLLCEARLAQAALGRLPLEAPLARPLVGIPVDLARRAPREHAGARRPELCDADPARFALWPDRQVARDPAARAVRLRPVLAETRPRVQALGAHRLCIVSVLVDLAVGAADALPPVGWPVRGVALAAHGAFPLLTLPRAGVALVALVGLLVALVSLLVALVGLLVALVALVQLIDARLNVLKACSTDIGRRRVRILWAFTITSTITSTSTRTK